MSLDTLNLRLQYQGGDQIGRINKQKFKSFQSALISSYQSRTILTPNTDTVWQALINNDNLKPDYDNKILSVSYESLLEAGDVFQVIDDNSYWMVYLPHLTETAYLRAEIRRCRYSMTINNTLYRIYFQGPTETDIRWSVKNSINWNDLNLSGTIYIKNNEETRLYFNRFTKFYINGHKWEVQVTDDISVPGVLELEVQEYFDNNTDDLPKISKEENQNIIIGKTIVNPNELIGYQIDKSYLSDDSSWSIINNNKVTFNVIKNYPNMIEVKIDSSASGSFTIKYGSYSIDVTINDSMNKILGSSEILVYSEDNIYDCNFSDTGNWSVDSTKVSIISQTSNQCKLKVLTGKKDNFNLIYNKSDGTKIIFNINIKSL